MLKAIVIILITSAAIFVTWMESESWVTASAATAGLLPFYLAIAFSFFDIIRSPIFGLFEAACGLILVSSMTADAIENYQKNSNPDVMINFAYLNTDKCPGLSFKEVKEIKTKGSKLCSAKALLDLSHDLMDIQKNIYLPPETGIANAFVPSYQKEKGAEETCYKYYQKIRNSCPSIIH